MRTVSTLEVILLLCFIHTVLGDDHTLLSMLERDFFSWRLDDRPEFASSIGHYRNGDRLEHFNLELMTTRMEKAKSLLDALQEIPTSELSKTDQLDYVIFQDMLRNYVEGYNWRNYNYLSPLSWLEGNQRDPNYFVLLSSFDNRGDFENYIARLNAMPQLFEEYKVLMNEAIRLGRTSHKAAVDRVPEQIDYFLETPVEESIYFIPFLEELELLNRTIPSHERNDIKRRGKQVIGAVYDAYKKLKDYLENIYMKHTRPLWGVGSLESGKEFYKACVNWYLSLNMTPEEIHDLGLQEVERVSGRMHAIKEKQGYGKISIREYFAELKKNEELFLHDQQAILEEYENIIMNRIEPMLSKLFRDQPGLPIQVKPMFSDGSRGQYISGTADGSRPGTFYANTFRKVPKYTMMSLAMHETNPGHHLQFSYELTAALPDFRRNKEHSEKFRVPFAIPSYSAFVEGWALYAESLGVESDLYENDYEMMGYYESEIFRAARLVVDTGLHYFNWSRDTAIEYFMNHTAESRVGIEVEVDRYITWPGQAVAYKVGELWIRKLREYAEEMLGDQFDIRDFHMVVLRNGAVPLNILESQVSLWVSNYKKEQEHAGDDCECTTPDPRKKSRCQRSASGLKDYEMDNGGCCLALSLSRVIFVALGVIFIQTCY